MRNAFQVAANGGLFAVLAYRAGAAPESTYGVAAAGALAAASADTWATELGTLWGRHPRSIVSWRPLRPGMSGAVTFVGTLGGVAGAVLIAVVVALVFARPLRGTFVVVR